MERLLITGVDSPLGANLALKLADRCQVLGTFFQNPVGWPHINTTHWDGCEGDTLDELDELAAQWQPQWIIHCGPLASSSWDEAPFEVSESHGAGGCARLAKVAGELKTRVTVISSDAVFTGPRMFHDESSPSLSQTARALKTRHMEQLFKSTRALIVRTHAYGWSPLGETAGFAELVAENLALGIDARVEGRGYATPILATDLAELLWRAHELRLEGVYHLAGAERTSADRFVATMAASLGLRRPGENCVPAMSDDECQDETSLSSKRARRMLEMATGLLREGLDRFAQQAEDGWRKQLRAAASAGRAHEFAA